MKTRLPGLLLMLVSLLLTACGGMEPPRPGIDVPATTYARSMVPVQQATSESTALPSDIPTPVTDNPIFAPTELANMGGMLHLIIEAPDTIQVNQVAEVTFSLYGELPTTLDKINIMAPVTMMAVTLLDAQPETPGTQVKPAQLPPTAQVIVNYITEMGVIAFTVSGLNLSGLIEQPLFTLTVRGAPYPGEMEIYVYSAEAEDTDGNPIPINYDNSALTRIEDLTTPQPPVVTQPTPVAPPPTVVSGEPGSGGLPVIVPAVLQEGVYYRILPGENLFRIGLRFGISWEQIAAVNGIRDPRFVPAGMILYIPVEAPVGSSAYYIRRGDTLYSICRGLNLRVVDVAALNGIPAPFNYIRADTWLMLAP